MGPQLRNLSLDPNPTLFDVLNKPSVHAHRRRFYGLVVMNAHLRDTDLTCEFLGVRLHGQYALVTDIRDTFSLVAQSKHVICATNTSVPDSFKPHGIPFDRQG